MGIWNSDDRLDLYEITDKRIRKNALTVAVVCVKNDLLDIGRGYSQLRVKAYGNALDLCVSESFYDQPMGTGSLCTGFLVADDVVVTTAHFTDSTNVKNLRFLFGYAMVDADTALTKMLNDKIYHGAEILHREYDNVGRNTTGSDWALVRLDRKVVGQEVAVLSTSNVFLKQPIYIIGHPCGLPLKYAPGTVEQNIGSAYFMAHVDVFMGNSGSPVFCAETHELVGILTRGDAKDFMWTADGLVSVIYPDKNIETYGARCTKVSEFKKYITGIGDMETKDGLRLQPNEISLSAQDEKFLKKFQAEIEKSLSDSEADFSIDALCKKLSIGRTELFKRVKAATGETPNQYIKSYRLERAVSLLEKGYGNVSEVAYAVGFSSSQYFLWCFKEKFQQSPTDFLNSIKQKEIDGTPKREEISKQVKQRYALEGLLDELLEQYTESEVIQKIKKIIQEKKSNIEK